MVTFAWLFVLSASLPCECVFGRVRAIFCVSELITATWCPPSLAGTPIAGPSNVSSECPKNPENGVAGLSVAGVRAEYVRAGETSGELPSDSSEEAI